MENRITVTLLLVCAGPLCCRGSWMFLGVSPGGADAPGGGDLPLSAAQRELCRKKPFLLPAVRDGARLAVAECHSQFRHERWNCTTRRDHEDVFGYELTSGTKETAFIYAVMAAGLVHAVTRACSQSNVTECGCHTRLQGGGGGGGGGGGVAIGDGAVAVGDGGGGADSASGAWHWGGCSDHVQYGLWFSRKFIDNTARNQTAAASGRGYTLTTMNLHNSEAGRQAVLSTMSTSCRCHGVSGSCAVKTCWKMAAAFQQVGVYLKDQYERGAQVWDRRRRKARRKEARGGGGGGGVPVDARRLVFINKSPNYCVEDARRGIAGTRGRRCNRTAGGADGCFLLCCGRGYNTHLVRSSNTCHCKFRWCCYVTCSRCESMKHLHTCK